MSVRYILCAVTLILAAGPASVCAIVVDINRGDPVLPNVSSNPYSGVGYTSGCTGTPVTSRLVVTAAHCYGPSENRGFIHLPYADQPSFTIWGDVTTYPGYDRRRDPFQQRDLPDLAVLELDSALPNYVKTYRVARHRVDPIGAPVEIVGYGLTGTGTTGKQSGTSSHAVKRYARNEVDRREGNFLVDDFDGGVRLGAKDPGGPGSTIGRNILGTDGLGRWEGTTAPGDSGGPMFFNPQLDLEVAFQRGAIRPGTPVKIVPSEPLLLGVTSFGTIYQPGQARSSYATTSSFTFVSPFVGWIESFASDVAVFSVEDLLNAVPAATESLDEFQSFAGPAPDSGFSVPPDPKSVAVDEPETLYLLAPALLACLALIKVRCKTPPVRLC